MPLLRGPRVRGRTQTLCGGLGHLGGSSRDNATMVSPLLEFKTLRILSSARLLTLGPRIDIGRSSIVTTVIRLPEDVAKSVHAQLRPLAEAHQGQHFYPPSTMHISIAGFAIQEDSDIPLIEGALRETVARSAPFSIDLVGLNLSPSTLFVQAFTPNKSLPSLRSNISRALQRESHLTTRRRPFPSRHVAFANVLRFLGPVKASALMRDVHRWKTHEFGCFDVRELELVRTDKFLSDEGTELLRAFSLHRSSRGEPPAGAGGS